MGGYKYRGTGDTMTEAEIAEHLKGVRAKVAGGNTDHVSAMATSREARAAMPAPALIQGHIERPPAEIARRNGTAPRLAGDADMPFSAPKEWHDEMNKDDGPLVRDLRPAPTIKGAVKVAEFPERSKYPFRQIADDGGIWEIEPAVFKVTPGAIVQAARKWAEGRRLAVKVTTDDGMVYVQFKAGA